MRTILKRALPATLVAFTLAGCSGDNIAAPFEREWNGGCDVEATFTSATQLTIGGVCDIADLGPMKVVAFQTIVPGPETIAYTNTTVYSLPNGDELHTTNVGVATPTSYGLSLSGVETAVGGTGRLKRASGTATLTGGVTFSSPSTTSGSYTLAGRLTY